MFDWSLTYGGTNEGNTLFTAKKHKAVLVELTLCQFSMDQAYFRQRPLSH